MQWNVRGLIHNLDDITELLCNHKPKVFCVQETHLNPKQFNFLRQFAIFRKDRDNANASSGGVAIIVDRSVACQQITLQTELEAVSIRGILFNRLITICSIYLPPNCQVSKTEFYSLINQLPEPYILAGDFNAHNSLWGDSRCDGRGRLIENFLVSSGACLFNKKEPTYYSTQHNSYSSIDLTIGSATLFPHLEWDVIRNPYGSDHFPAVLKLREEQSSLPQFPRWKLASADWKGFKESSRLSQDFLKNLNIDDAVTYFTAFIIDSAQMFIPETNGYSSKRRVPWWNEDCRKARKKQNKAWGILRRYPNAENLVEFKQAKSQGRRTRRQARRQSWEKFISGINSYTQERKVWNGLRRLKGQETYPLPLVDEQGNSLEEQADALGAHFESISSSMHYTESFRKYKETEECKALNRNCQQNEPYNRPFNMAELRAALNTCKSSAPGADRVVYDMIKNLHADTQMTLLALLNNIWATGYLPAAWKEAIIVPILKQGKDPSVLTSYRPIALTSCLCKLFEKMINRRLLHYLESNNLLDPHQCGFRESRSTTDHLVRIEANIRDAFVHKQYFLAVFLDLEKAYDTTWRFGILQDLSAIGIRGNMLNVIESYLSNRTFRVRIGNVLSKPYVQETGVPQGGVLSCTLFIVKMNSLRNFIPHNMFYSIYVDDVQIAFKSCNIAICERHIQLGLNKVSKWANQNGFKLNPQKSSCVLFTRQRGLDPEPHIELYGQLLPVSTEHKFLGLILDSKLTFLPHIKYLKAKCLKTMNIIKILSHTTWGSDRKCLLNLHKSLVRSRLDYGSIVYASAAPSALKVLDPVHHLGIRLATGAFRTSPVQSLYVESNEWSLNFQRQYLSVAYFWKVNANIYHPYRSVINDTACAALFHNRTTAREPFSLRVRRFCEDMDVPLFTHALMAPANPLPPWSWQEIDCDMTFVEVSKHAPEAHIHMHFLELKEKYACPAFYTDASKSHAGVAYAAIGPSYSQSGVMHPETSIFTAEAFALLTAAKHIKSLELKKAVIFTDSLSVVKALVKVQKHKNAVVHNLYSVLCGMYVLNQRVTLCWVPGHRGIEGNVLADELATSTGMKGGNTSLAVPVTDLKPLLRSKLRSCWQNVWDRETSNKLHLIKPYLGNWPSTTKSRRREVLICRLRIGHTYTTHNYLLTGEDPPTCNKCGQGLTVLHALLECRQAEPERKKYFQQAYRENIPLHPAMFLGRDPIFDTDTVLNFVDRTTTLHIINPKNT